MLERLRRYFAYDDWANREALAVLAEAGAATAKPLKLMAHIVAAEWLWLARLQQQPAPMAVWPELTAAQVQTQLEKLKAAWQGYLYSLSERDLDDEIEYVNTKGQHYRSRREDILMHVAMHGAYHRGQIATHMRAAGYEPAYTDFIHAVRRGYV